MKQIGSVLYIDFQELISIGISESTIKSGIQRNLHLWQSIKNPDDKRRLLIKYDTLKSVYKELVKEKLCNKQDPYKYYSVQKQDKLTTLLESLITIDLTHKDFFRSTGYYKGIEVDQLAEASAWLSMVIQLSNNKQWYKKQGYSSKKQFLLAVMTILDNKKLTGIKKVTNYISFTRKLQAFEESGLSSLISGKHGNKNSVKLDDIQKTALRTIYEDHRKFPFSTIHNKYIELASKNGWPKVTFETVRSYLMRNDVQYIAQYSRNGEAHWRNTMEPILKRKGAKRPNDMWVIDGSPWELFYKEYDENKKRWNMRKRIYGFPVVDVHSWKIIAFANGTTETEDLVFASLKNAYKNTGVLPRVLQTDNSAAVKSNSMQEWFKGIPTFYIPATPRLARVKIIEPMFGFFNIQILKEYHNFSGCGVKAKKADSHVHEEWLLQHPEYIPEKEEVLQQIAQAVERWNNHKMGDGLSPNQKYTAIQNSDVYKLDFNDEINYFWKYKMSKKGERQLYQYKNDGLKIQHNKIKYFYHVYDASGQIDREFWSNYINDKFNVKFDFEDLGIISLYKDGKFVALAQEQKEGNMCVIDNTSDDAKYLDQFLNRRKEMMQDVKTLIDEDQRVAEENNLDYELVDAEGYAKAPYPVDGVFKDRSNEAESLIKSRSTHSIYKTNNKIEIVDEEDEL